jgi:hypothetical protein
MVEGRRGAAPTAAGMAALRLFSGPLSFDLQLHFLMQKLHL